MYNQLAVYFQIRIVCRNNRSKKNIKLIIKVDIEYISNSIEPDENGFYFGNLTESAVTHNFHKYCPNHKLHDLRHTFATRCIENGISMKVIQRWLGHASFKTTADIYAEVQDRFNLEESAKINAFFDTHFDTHFCENDQKND